MTHHTPSQSSCKELHTLLEARGEVMETEYWWNEKTESLTRRQYRYSYSHHFNEGGGEEEGKRAHKNIPAPLATEILERLPEYLKLNVSHITLTCDFSKGNSSTYYFSPSSPVRYHHLQNAPTLAQAVTEMYIHLIKESLI